MEKKHRDTLIGLAIALLVLIVPFLNSCLSFRTVRIDSPEREPVYPVEEAAAPETTKPPPKKLPKMSPRSPKSKPPAP